MSSVILRNISNAQQWAMVNGERIEIQPLAQKAFDRRTAESLIAGAAPLSLQVVDGHTVFEEAVQQYDEEEYVYLANNTGNVREPAEIEVQVFDKDTQRLKKVMVPNPIKEPHTVKLDRPPEEVEYTTSGGNVRSRMNIKKPLYIPPHGQLKVKRSEANILLASLITAEGRSKLFKSRPRPEWMPDINSSIAEIKAFATMILGDQHALVKGIPTEGTLRKGKGDAKSKEDKVLAAKLELLQSLFFYVVDPAIRLPSMSEFRQFYFNAVDNNDVDDSAIEAAINKAEKDLDVEA